MMMPRFRFPVLAALVLGAATTLHADWLLQEANKNLLAYSPSAKALADEIRRACPGFTLALSREPLPSLIQLRMDGPGRYAGVINVEKVKHVGSVPELAVAGIYFLTRKDLLPGKGGGKVMMIQFLDKVRMELKKADPVRYGKLKPVRLSAES